MTKEKELEADAVRRSVFDLRVFVVGGGHAYLKMFYEAGFRGATSVEDADIVCFTGGEDVDPSFYGEEPLEETHFSTIRDLREKDVYEKAVLKGAPMVGICRGSQFLNVMNGGKLWQDVNNHCIGHEVIDFRNGNVVKGMTSTHHQQMIEGPGAEIIAAAQISTVKKSQSETLRRPEPLSDDLEVVFYPQTNSLCFQPHPEFRHGECRDYFLDLVDDLILPAT